MPFDLPIERRFPYLDRRLMEFCLALPAETKYEHLTETRKRNVRGRALQRHSLKQILPAEILRSRVKVNFTEVYRNRFRQYKKAYIDMFAPPHIPLAAELGYIEQDKFWAVLSESLARSERSDEIPPLVYLWTNRITQLEIWLQAVMRSDQGDHQVSCTDESLRSQWSRAKFTHSITDGAFERGVP
jgi:asparagine synthase (glutamine-hydrolysing)